MRVSIASLPMNGNQKIMPSYVFDENSSAFKDMYSVEYMTWLFDRESKHITYNQYQWMKAQGNSEKQERLLEKKFKVDTIWEDV